MIDKFLTKVFGSSNQRYLKSIQPIINHINELEPSVKRLSDDELRARLELVEHTNKPSDVGIIERCVHFIEKTEGTWLGEENAEQEREIFRPGRTVVMIEIP